MKVSLIIPIYNESPIINDAIKTFSGYMGEHFEDWELIFINDGSKDGCENAVAEAEKKNPKIRLCGYDVNQGKGYAVRTGMMAATGDIIIFTDCDNAYGTDVIGEMAKRFNSGDADIIVGSRNISKDGYEGYTFMRKLASKAYIKVIAITAGFKLTDSQCGFKGFRSCAAKRIFSNCEVNRWAFDLEAIMIAEKLGYKIAEMPVKVINHRESKVKMLRDSIKMLDDLRKMKKNIKNKQLK